MIVELMQGVSKDGSLSMRVKKMVYLPENTGWLAEYLYEFSGFPNGRFDDQYLDFSSVGQEKRKIENVQKSTP